MLCNFCKPCWQMGWWGEARERLLPPLASVAEGYLRPGGTRWQHIGCSTRSSTKRAWEKTTAGFPRAS